MSIEARRPRIVDNVKIRPLSPTYNKLEQGEVVKLNDIRNEAPRLDQAVANEINAGMVVGQGTFFEGIIVYKARPGEGSYGLPKEEHDRK